MSKTLFCFNILIFLLILSCIRGKSYVKEKDFQERPVISDTCIKTELYECIKNYILENDKKLLDRNSVYSVYFFERDSIDYFTIWVFNSFPKYLEFYNPNISFDFINFKILDRNVVFITRKDSKKIELYNLCLNNLTKKEDDHYQKEIPEMIYDGSLFPQTYQYNKVEGKFIILNADTLIIDFLGEDYLKYENRLKELNNKAQDN